MYTYMQRRTQSKYVSRVSNMLASGVGMPGLWQQLACNIHNTFYL